MNSSDRKNSLRPPRYNDKLLDNPKLNKDLQDLSPVPSEPIDTHDQGMEPAVSDLKPPEEQEEFYTNDDLFNTSRAPQKD